jgi:hypothetical protein
VRDRQALRGAHVHAGVALDAAPVGEHGLHVAVEAALRFLPRRGHVEAELDLGQLEFDSILRKLDDSYKN